MMANGMGTAPLGLRNFLFLWKCMRMGGSGGLGIFVMGIWAITLNRGCDRGGWLRRNVLESMAVIDM